MSCKSAADTELADARYVRPLKASTAAKVLNPLPESPDSFGAALLLLTDASGAAPASFQPFCKPALDARYAVPVNAHGWWTPYNRIDAASILPLAMLPNMKIWLPGLPCSPSGENPVFR